MRNNHIFRSLRHTEGTPIQPSLEYLRLLLGDYKKETSLLKGVHSQYKWKLEDKILTAFTPPGDGVIEVFQINICYDNMNIKRQVLDIIKILGYVVNEPVRGRKGLSDIMYYFHELS